MAEVVRQEWMTDEVYEWACLEKQARLNTLKRYQVGGHKMLIAIKAQHPLNGDGTPGPEYEARLKKALEVAGGLVAKGYEVDFMTFGGVHEGCQTESLADAGVDWLMENALITRRQIHASRMVYSGNDEDYLAAEKFAYSPEYRQLHVILSAGQWDRSRLYFIYMGWQPEMHPITFLDADPYHSSVCELWGPWAVPAFAEGPEAVAKTTAEIRAQHMADALK